MEDAAGALSTSSPPEGRSNGSTHRSITALNQKAHQVVDKAAHAAMQTTDWLAHSPRHLADQTAAYVKASPLKAAGMAFLAGLVLGRLLR